MLKVVPTVPPFRVLLLLRRRRLLSAHARHSLPRATPSTAYLEACVRSRTGRATLRTVRVSAGGKQVVSTPAPWRQPQQQQH
jgi:hypothetical protein